MNNIGHFSNMAVSHLFPPGASNFINTMAYDPIHAASEQNIYDISFGNRRRIQEQDYYGDEEEEIAYTAVTNWN